jgi:hypothetical protein
MALPTPSKTVPAASQSVPTTSAVTSEKDATVKTPTVLPTLNFEDVEVMPDAKDLNAQANPFQAKINELAKSGKGSSVVVPDADVDWVRAQVRRACGNINLGATTRFTAEAGRPGMSRVFFSTKAKTTRARKSS